MAANERDEVLFAAPTRMEERLDLADACIRDLGIEAPALVDGMDNAVERSYTAWPDRLYVIDDDGRVAYKSGPGPYGFKPAEMERVLGRLVD